MRVPLDNVDSDDMEQTPSQTDSRERGFKRNFQAEDFGHSDELDPDDVGDIADEGPGHRG